MRDIFLDIRGKLEGESIVGEAFRDTANLLCFEGHPQPEANYTRYTRMVPIRDWTEPIRRMVQTLDRDLTVNFNIHITDRLPSNTSLSLYEV